uniref:Ankyrin repeat domain-containing protein 50-like n=1 Tax=Hippocampus comes TaxID=109280 RepID=A0A3Q2ZIZ8_HIPCM
MSDPGLLHGRRFFCREWALDELRRCLDARRAGPGRPTGVLVTGGPGAGKTALCAEVVRPDSEAGRASGLASRCLARHFCRREEPASGLAWRFVMALAEQLRASPLLPPEYGASVGRRSPPDPLSCQADPQVAFQRFVRIAVYRDLDGGQGSWARALFPAPIVQTAAQFCSQRRELGPPF